MKAKAVWILLGCLMASPGWAASKTNAVITIFSSSQQFIVQGVPLTGQPLTAGSSLTNPVLRLDPALLAVSCERIKRMLLQELDLADHWRGKIRLHLQFTLATNPPVTIQSTFYGADGWQYRIVLPDEIRTSKLVRVVVEALLLELANRHGGPHLAEVPLWLTEGFTRHLMGLASMDLVLQPFTRTVRLQHRIDPVRTVRDRLRTRSPLSFNQLSLPTPAVLGSENWETYQACAQLLVAELLRLKKGRAALREMLDRLPQHWNWQTAFLSAFHHYFPQLLEVEKWWALTLVNAQGHNEWQGWAPATSWDKLDEILHLPAQVRYATNDLPVRFNLSLQQFIEAWDYIAQRNILREKINLLQVLRLNVAPELLPLVDAYHLALERYLDKRARIDREAALRGQPLMRPEFLAREVMKQLDTLDAQRVAARPTPNPGPGNSVRVAR